MSLLGDNFTSDFDLHLSSENGSLDISRATARLAPMPPARHEGGIDAPWKTPGMSKTQRAQLPITAFRAISGGMSPTLSTL